MFEYDHEDLDFGNLPADNLRDQRIAFLASFLATMKPEELTEFHGCIWENREAMDGTADDIAIAVGELSDSDPDKAIEIITSLAEDSGHSSNRWCAAGYLGYIADVAPLETRLKLWDQLVRDEDQNVRKSAIGLVIVDDTGYPNPMMAEIPIPENLDTPTDFGDKLTWRQALDLYSRYEQAEAGENIHQLAQPANI